MATESVTVLYEDEEVLALGKPAGLIVHSDGRREEPTLADWVLEHYPALREVGEPTELSDGRVIARPGVVHRLDRETSGVILVAKTNESFAHLKSEFQLRRIEKRYRAFAHGRIKNERGEIALPIARSSADFRRWSAERGARGTSRDALTHYRVLEQGASASYLELEPRTGRTHQIRVHMRAIGHPLVGDRLYAPKRANILGFERCALHALSIEWNDRQGRRMHIEAGEPTDFVEGLRRLRAGE